ncbi:DUF1289 domain-containing protein [Magnetospirillum molischianum]|uniref:DUF1289 domain-containing protein n=1 Tax=Magnetospirillum molischianum TaxID=1083 RepID=UPI0009DA7AA4|nr:DUF1289 domain-containing protein [Magnetospirillum molischianum]
MSKLPPESPCISRCHLDFDRGCCAGCGRTTDEIAAWPEADDQFRREILARSARRLTAPPQRR